MGVIPSGVTKIVTDDEEHIQLFLNTYMQKTVDKFLYGILIAFSGMAVLFWAAVLTNALFGWV